MCLKDEVQTTSKPQQAHTPTMGRALSMIARRPLEQGLTKIETTAVETAAPADPFKKACHNTHLVAL